MYSTIVRILAAQTVPSDTGTRYQDEWLKAVDLKPMASALRIATANKAGEYSGQLAQDLHRGLHFMQDGFTIAVHDCVSHFKSVHANCLVW